MIWQTLIKHTRFILNTKKARSKKEDTLLTERAAVKEHISLRGEKMGFINMLKEKIKNLDIWDIGLIKWASIFFGAILGAYLVVFVKQYLAVIVTIMILLVIRPIMKFFRKV